MRICHVTPHLPPDQAANALLPAQLAEWARAAGRDVSVLSYEPAQAAAAAIAQHEVIRLPRRSPSHGLRKLLRIDSARHARDIDGALGKAAANASILHLHSNGLIVEIAARWALRRQKPYLLTLYGTEIWHYRSRWPVDLFTRAYHGASAVTFYSRGLRDKANELELTRPDQHVIYPAVAREFRPHDVSERLEIRRSLGIAEGTLLLNVKRLHELAGQRFLIDAFAQATRGRNDVRLVICGTGPLQSALEAQAGALGIAPKVTFAGLVPNEIVARYNAAADLFVLPSLLEALPTVAVEALASGTPVLTANHPGGVELHALFGDDVRVVPRSNASALAAGLTEAMNAPRRVGAATIASVQQHFGTETVRRSYDALYRRLVPGW
jgi:glycosyltransferase involved in cell wall biosynthesis